MFTLKNNRVSPEPSILTLEPFKGIWERDKTKDKDKALKEIAYVYFMLCPRRENVFSGYRDSDRERKVVEHLFGGKKFKPDKLVVEAMDFYEDYLENGSLAMRLYKANLANIEAMILYLEGIDYGERTNSGSMVHNLTKNSQAGKDSAELLEGLQKLEAQVYKDDYQEGKSLNSMSEWEV